MNKAIVKQAREFAGLWGGFRAARVVLTANNYNIFEHLKIGRTAGQLADILETNFRATEILLDAVTSLGLLAKQGKRYQITSPAEQFLLKESPRYQGDMLRHADALWNSWSNLDAIVKTGLPTRSESRDHEVFIRAMHDNAIFRAPAVVKALDLRGVKTALDLGGGPGTYSIELAKKGIAVTLFDVPSSLEVAKSFIRTSKAKTIELKAGDFLTDPVGKDYDLVLISQVLHSYSEEKNMALLDKARKALKPRGRVVIHEFFVGPNRAYPPVGALFSVNMLVNTSNGRCYTPQEMKKWLVKARFKNVGEKLINDTVLVIGTKR
jgi:2-polyprenyl-3-methyl-5-hydroxy-6-metoxy-1,4-benzoquinol methylase